MMLTKAANRHDHVHTKLRGRGACTCCTKQTMVKARRAQRRREAQALRSGAED